jgi:hypothetical protein
MQLTSTSTNSQPLAANGLSAALFTTLHRFRPCAETLSEAHSINIHVAPTRRIQATKVAAMAAAAVRIRRLARQIIDHWGIQETTSPA